MPASVAASYIRSSICFHLDNLGGPGETAPHQALTPTTASTIPMARQSLLARCCACGDIHKPHVIPAVHKPVGKVVHAGQDTDQIKGRPNPSLHRCDQRAGGVVRSKRCKAESADAVQPQLRVEPTMQMQDVKEQIDQGDESRPPLPAVATVAGEAILAGCWTFRSWQSKHQSRRERSAGVKMNPHSISGNNLPGLWIM